MTVQRFDGHGASAYLVRCARWSRFFLAWCMAGAIILVGPGVVSGQDQPWLKENPGNPEITEEQRHAVAAEMNQTIKRIPKVTGRWTGHSERDQFRLSGDGIFSQGGMKWKPGGAAEKAYTLPRYTWDGSRRDYVRMQKDFEGKYRTYTGFRVRLLTPRSRIRFPWADWSKAVKERNFTWRYTTGLTVVEGRGKKKSERWTLHQRTYLERGALKGFKAVYLIKEESPSTIPVGYLGSTVISGKVDKATSKIIGRYRYDGFRYPLILEVRMYYPPRKTAAAPEVIHPDEIASEMIDAIYRATGVRSDSEPDTEPAPDPEPRQPEPDAVVADTSPRPDATDGPKPEASEGSVADLVERMDGGFEWMEDQLQAVLLLIKTISREIETVQTAMFELRDARQEFNDPATKQKAAVRIRKYQEAIAELIASRTQMIAETRKGLRDKISRLQKLYNEHDFGELDFHAALRVEAMKSRLTLFDAQVALLTNDPDEAMRVVGRMREDPTLQSASYYVEGMARLSRGRTIDALEAFRSARRRGYEQAIGGTFDGLEKSVEIHILKQLQALTTNEATRFRDEFENWIAAKAETERDPNTSMFGRYVERSIWRGWYDTVSGALSTGGAEAKARGFEVGLVLDDMAKNHRGLGIIIGLRENHRLPEIKAMTRNQFAAACHERWGVKLSPEKLAAMRQLVHYAFQMDDMKTLASEEVLLEGDVLSRPLVMRIESETALETSASYAATGGNFINGWTMLLTMAPAAKLSGSGYAGTGLSWAAGSTVQTKEIATLGEWFGSTRPVSSALEAANKWGPGKKATQAMIKLHAWSQRSSAHTAAALLGEAVFDAGVSYSAHRTLGEEAGMLVDAFQALGGTSSHVWAGAAKRMGLTADRATDMAQMMRRRAAAARSAAQSLDETYRTLKTAQHSGQVDLTTLRRNLAGNQTAPATMKTRLAQAIDEAAAGKTQALEQTLKDFDQARGTVLRRAEQTVDAARVLERAKTKLPRDVELAETSVVNKTRRSNQQLRQEAGPGSAVDTTGPPRDVGRTVAERAPARLRPVDPVSPLGQIDALSAEGKWSEAIIECHRASLARSLDDPIHAQIQQKLKLLRRTKREAKKIARLKAARHSSHNPPKVTDSTSEAFNQFRRANYNRWGIARGQQGAHPTAENLTRLGQPEAAHVVPVRHFYGRVDPQTGTAMGSAADPMFIYGKNRKLLGVRKNAEGMLDHPEGMAEELASRINEALGRPGPRARVHEVTARNPATGSMVKKKYLVTELLPSGRPLDDILNGPHQLLARKDEISEDIVFSLFMGDGDRHFGNYWISDYGEVIPMDYGLADLFPEHPYRQPLYVAQPEHPGSLYRPSNQGKPVPHTSPEFDDYVRKLMKRHWNHGTRHWRHPAFADTFPAAMTYESMAPHIQKFKKLCEPPGPGQPSRLSKLLDATMGTNHPHRAYTGALLKKRAEILDEFLKNPDVVPGEILKLNHRLTPSKWWLRGLPIGPDPLVAMQKAAA